MAGSASPRIVFVADELLGYAGNGIGTTTTFVSLALARAGHRVEVLFAGRPPEAPVADEWRRLYERAGVAVRQVPDLAERVAPGMFARARDVEAALRADPPDVVVVQDLGAPAYTALRLRRLGLAFEHTAFVVFCHGTRRWITDVSRRVRSLPGAHAVSTLERAAVELADAVVSPSAYLVDWMRDEGWRLPQQTFVIPHVSRSGATGEPPPAPPAPRRVERIAFFGRLEDRKGVLPFVEALNALRPDAEVEFVGRPTAAWPVERVRGLLSIEDVAFETSLDQHEALERLRRPGTLVVIPSFEENSPNTVYECLENGLPFIASDVAGIRELVAADDRARILFEPTAAGIATALRQALAADAWRPARVAVDDAESLRRWDEVFRLPVAQPAPRGPAHDVEVIVGERRPASAEWVVYLAEDDVPQNGLVETLVHAQQVSGADVVSCGLFLPDGSIQLFPGEPRALGLLGNGYGTVALIRRSLLEGVEELDDDWPLLAELSVRGASIVSVPLPLVASAKAPATLETHPLEALRVMRHFERALPDNLRLTAELVPRLAAGLQRPAPAPRSFARRAVRRLMRVGNR